MATDRDILIKIKSLLDGRGFDDLDRRTKGSQKNVGLLGKAFKALAPALGVATVVYGLKKMGDVIIEAEDAFAGVRKTVDATEEEFKVLNQNLIDLSKTAPITFTEFAKIGELAGQLGVSGVENITKFTDVVAKIGVTTNLTTETAATDFARLANIMQEPIQNVDRMGATIVDLGNNFASTEQDIDSFALRIAGAGKLVGMSTADVMAFGTAFSSVGVKAEMGGTAVSKALVAMGEAVVAGGSKLALFANTAGMTAEQFKKSFKEDAARTFKDFIEGLGRQGLAGASTLDMLELSDQRLKRAFLSVASAGDLLNRTIEKGREGWQRNTALTEEANKKYKTGGSVIKSLQNAFAAMIIELQDDFIPLLVEDVIPAVRELLPVFKLVAQGVVKSVQGIILIVKELYRVTKPIWDALGGLIERFEEHYKRQTKTVEVANVSLRDFSKKTTETVKKDQKEQTKAVADGAKERAFVTDEELKKRKKAEEEAAKEVLQHYKDKLDERKALREVDLRSEIDYWEEVKANAKLTADRIKEVDRELWALRAKLRAQDEKKHEDCIEVIANSTIRAAKGTLNVWERTSEGIAEVVTKKAVEPIASGLNSALGNFGGLGTVLIGGVGGAIGMAVSGFLNLLGGQSKSVAEYTKEAYNRMVNSTQEKLDELTMGKTEIAKAMSVVESLASRMPVGARFGASPAASAIRDITGINIVGLTRGQALQALSQASGKLPSKYDVKSDQIEAVQDYIGEVISQISSAKHRKYYSGKLAAGTLQAGELEAIATLARPSGDVGSLMGELKGQFQAMRELQAELGALQLEALNDAMQAQQRAADVLAQEAASVVPQAAKGGYVEKGGLVNVHTGETITPAGSGNTIQVLPGAIVINGVNFTNESQKRQVAKELAGFLFGYTSEEVPLPNGQERRF